MKTLLRTLALWVVLGGVAWILIQPESPTWDSLLAGAARLALPALAAWLTLRAVAGLPDGRGWRGAFWVVTMAGWLAVGVLAAGRFENPAHRDDRAVLVLAGLCAVLLPAWASVKARRLPRWSVLRDAAAGAFILAGVGAGIVTLYDAQTQSLATRAEARWTEIGLPMAEFEQTLAPVAENAGSEVVRQVLREHLGQRFYKPGTPAAEREPEAPGTDEAWKLVNRACDIISAKLPPADEVDVSTLPVAALEPHAAALEASYRRILAAEPAVWACDPADGPAISVPNFLGLRMFSQLTGAESMRRLAAGDEEGAARAIAAGLRLPEGLERSPVLVSLMIRVAIEALYAPRQVRLPATDDGLDAIARDTAALRAAFLRTLRWEGWMCLRLAEQLSSADEACFGQNRILPEWAHQLAGHHFLRRQFAIAALNGADHAAIRQAPATLALPDFGASLDDAISTSRPSICEINASRAAMRIHATLLLREQTALIRDARARFAAGRPVESRDSAVLPGVRWELTADAVKRTVATRLVNAPKWIVEGTVTGGDEFWVLPLDGRVGWQFRTLLLGAAEAR